MKMKCIKSLVYNGHRYQVGEEFEVASAQDRKILAAIKKAVVAPAVAAGPAWAPAVEEARKKRTYTRRDLVAEPTPRTVLVAPVREPLPGDVPVEE